MVAVAPLVWYGMVQYAPWRPPMEKAPAPLQPPACLFSSGHTAVLQLQCAVAPTVSLSAALAYISPAHTSLPPVGVKQVQEQHLLHPGRVSNMKIANAVSDRQRSEYVNLTSLNIAAGLCLGVPSEHRGQAFLPRVPIRWSPPQLRPQPEDREECPEPVQQWERQLSTLGIWSGFCACLQD